MSLITPPKAYKILTVTRLPPRKSGPVVDLSAFKEPPYAFFTAALFFAIWGVYYTFYYVSAYPHLHESHCKQRLTLDHIQVASFGVEKAGLQYTSSTILIIVINGVGVPARILPGFFADKVGQMNMFFPAVCCLTVVAYSWLAVDSLVGLYVFTCFYGLMSAAFQGIVPSTVASLTPNLSMVGTRLGMAFSTLSFAALTGPPLGGALQSAMGGSYVGASIWAATSMLIAAFLVGAARVAKAGWKPMAKC